MLSQAEELQVIIANLPLHAYLERGEGLVLGVRHMLVPDPAQEPVLDENGEPLLDEEGNPLMRELPLLQGEWLSLEAFARTNHLLGF